MRALADGRQDDRLNIVCRMNEATMICTRR